MLAVPVVEGVNVVLQVAVPAVVPAAKVQVVNVPVTPLTVNVTEPVGGLMLQQALRPVLQRSPVLQVTSGTLAMGSRTLVQQELS